MGVKLGNFLCSNGQYLILMNAPRQLITTHHLLGQSISPLTVESSLHSDCQIESFPTGLT